MPRKLAVGHIWLFGMMSSPCMVVLWSKKSSCSLPIFLVKSQLCMAITDIWSCWKGQSRSKIVQFSEAIWGTPNTPTHTRLTQVDESGKKTHGPRLSSHFRRWKKHTELQNWKKKTAGDSFFASTTWNLWILESNPIKATRKTPTLLEIQTILQHPAPVPTLGMPLHEARGWSCWLKISCGESPIAALLQNLTDPVKNDGRSLRKTFEMVLFGWGDVWFFWGGESDQYSTWLFCFAVPVLALRVLRVFRAIYHLSSSIFSCWNVLDAAQSPYFFPCTLAGFHPCKNTKHLTKTKQEFHVKALTIFHPWIHRTISSQVIKFNNSSRRNAKSA